jgi:pectate lyase
MPSVRYGRVHIFNSYFNSPGNNSCLNFRLESQVRLENSYFEDIDRPWVSTRLTGTTYGKLNISGNTLVNCTNVNGTMGGDTVFTVTYPYNLQSASAAKTSVLAGAGSRL